MAHPEAHDAGSEEHPCKNQADSPENYPQVRFGKLEKPSARGRKYCFLSMHPVLWNVRISDSVRDLRLNKERVSLSGDGLHIEGFVGGIPQGNPKLVNGGIYVSVIIDVRVCGP